MCINPEASRAVCTWSRSACRRVFGDNILRSVWRPHHDGARRRGGLSAEKPRSYFFIFLVFLATFLVAFAVFFAFFAFLAMSSSWFSVG
jgi:hypothetical protein